MFFYQNIESITKLSIFSDRTKCLNTCALLDSFFRRHQFFNDRIQRFKHLCKVRFGIYVSFFVSFYALIRTLFCYEPRSMQSSCLINHLMIFPSSSDSVEFLSSQQTTIHPHGRESIYVLLIKTDRVEDAMEKERH